MKKAFFILSLAVSALTVMAQDQYVAPLKGSVNLRTSPSTSAPKAGTLAKSSLLPVIEELDGWYKVDFNGKTAYVSQSVTSTCDAVVPQEIYGKELSSSAPLDKTRFQGSILIEAVDKSHALITVNWMRVNLPAETQYFLADVSNGKIVASYGGASYVEASSPVSEIKNELFELDSPVPVGFDEFNNTIYFDGAVYSEYE